MSAPYFIEMLARNGDVLHRHRVEQLPIRFGRGYDNDFIVDDAFAAPRHAVVESGANGELVLRDLGSLNGVVVNRGRKTSLAITGDTIFRIGHTWLRVRPADFAVKPEVLDRTAHWWEGAVPGLVGLILVGLFALFTRWLSDTQSFQLVGYLQALAYGIGAALVWGGAWAFANRLFGRHARLGRHLFIAGCGLTAVTLYKVASSVFGYAFSLEALTMYSSHAAIVIAAGVIFYHLRTVKPHHTRRFGTTCLILALLASGLTLISNEQRTGHMSDSLYMSVIMPPSVRMSGDHSVDEFMGDVSTMQRQLDVERTKKVKDEGGD